MIHQILHSSKRTKLLLLYLICCSLNSSIAQHLAFWSEDFSNSSLDISLPEGWNSDDISENTDASNNPVDILWSRCPSSTANCPINNISGANGEELGTFKATSSENGYAYAYSLAAGLFNPTNDAPHISQLTSPLIAIPEGSEYLFLEFQSYLFTINIREHEGTRLFVRAEGSVWQEYNIYPDLPNYPSGSAQTTHNANRFRIDLSDWSNVGSIQLRWEWTGINEEVWCLDDIKLFNYNPLTVRSVWSGGDFNGGLNDWTVNNGGAGSCSWEWQALGSYGNAFLPAGNDNKFINSPTAQNGAMVVNGDYCYTNNEFPSYPLENFSIFETELVSPLIDLSATTNELQLDFYQVFRKLELSSNGNFTPFYYAYSTNAGLDWSEAIPLNQSQSQNLTYQSHLTLALPSALIGQANVRIKFIFNGKLFYWGIDDVRILERPAFDLAISEDFYAVPSNYATPASQTDSIAFLADIENEGTLAQGNVKLKIEIVNIETEESVFEDSLSIGSIEPLSISENNLFPTAFLPPSLPAHYKGIYTVYSPQADEIPGNNSVEFEFEITEKLFAKQKSSSLGFKPMTKDYAWGNVFYLTNGQGFRAKSIEVGIENVDEMVGYPFQTRLYKWFDNQTDTFNISPEEYELVAVDTHFVTELDDKLISIPLGAPNNPVLLEDNMHYLAVVYYEKVATSDPDCFISTSQKLDYEGAFFTSLLREDFRYVTASDPNLDGTYSVVGIGSGSGFDFIPLVRLNIQDAEVSTQDIVDFTDLKVYPNPALSHFYVEYANETSLNLEIINTMGQSVKHLEGLATGSKISLSGLAKGLYYLKFSNKASTLFATKKLNIR